MRKMGKIIFAIVGGFMLVTVEPNVTFGQGEGYGIRVIAHLDDYPKAP